MSELENAAAVLDAEERVRSMLDLDLGGIESRAERHAALEDAVGRLDRGPDSDEVRLAWGRVVDLCWELALGEIELARFEARRRHVRAPLTPEDLEQEALVGLYEAACRFEPERGLRFGTYARWWVRARLNVVVQHGLSAVRVPDSVTRDLRKLHAAARRLRGRDAEVAERAVAVAAGVDPRRAERIAGLLQTESLDVRLEDGAATRKELLPGRHRPDQVVSRREQVARVRSLLRTELDERDRAILSHRYGMGGGRGESFRRIGERLDLTSERVRQLHHRAIRALRARV